MKKPIQLRENKHPFGNIQKSHFHEKHQILYTLENKGTLSLNNEKYSFDKGSLIFIPPYTPHEIYSNEKMTVLILEFDEKALDKITGDILKQELFTKAKFYPITVLEQNELKI